MAFKHGGARARVSNLAVLCRRPRRCDAPDESRRPGRRRGGGRRPTFEYGPPAEPNECRADPAADRGERQPPTDRMERPGHQPPAGAAAIVTARITTRSVSLEYRPFDWSLSERRGIGRRLKTDVIFLNSRRRTANSTG